MLTEPDEKRPGVQRCRKAFLGLLWIALWGCVSTGHFNPAALEDYASQKRIVRQGFARVPVGDGDWDAVYFGYDRNRDYNRRVQHPRGRGVDLVEYKRLGPGGRWEFSPFLLLVDEDFDGDVDWICLDRDRDGVWDAVYAPAKMPLHLDQIDFKIFRPFENRVAAD